MGSVWFCADLIKGMFLKLKMNKMLLFIFQRCCHIKPTPEPGILYSEASTDVELFAQC